MASRFAVGIVGTKTWTNADTSIWSATSGGASGASVPGSGDTVTLDALSGSGTLQPNYDMTVTSITMGSFTGTLDFLANNNNPSIGFFSNTGTGTRTLNMGNGTWSITASAGTEWNMSTITNLTFNSNGSTLQFTYSGSVGTRIINTGASTMMYNNVSITAGSDIISQSGTFTINGNFSTVGFTGTYSKASSALTVGGNLTLGTGSTWSSTGGTFSLVSSGSASINTNGVNFNQAVSVNGTGTFTLASAIDMTGANAGNLNITQGTFTTGDFNISATTWNSSNTNTRTINLGSSTINITGNATTVFSMATTTNLTFNAGTSVFNFTYSGSTGTRTTLWGNAPVFNNVNITAGSDTVSSSQLTCNTFDSTGFTGTFTKTSASFFINGNFILGTGSTWSSTNGIINFVGTGTQTFNTNGVVVNQAVTINATGTVNLASNIDMTGAVTASATFTVTKGTFSTANFNMSMYAYNSGVGTRNVSFGSSTITLTGVGTVFNISSVSGLTFNAGTSTIILTDSSSSTKTISDLGVTLYNLTFSGTGTGAFIIGVNTAAMTINNLTIVNPPHTVNVFAGKTINVTSIIWSGTAGNLNTFKSSVNGTAWFINVPTGTVSQDYISLQDSHADGGATFYAGSHSTNVSNNTGWIFGSPSITSQNSALDQNHVHTIIGSQNNNSNGTILIYANPTSHGLAVNDGTTGGDFGQVNASRDQNFFPGIVAVSSTDGVSTVPLYVDTSNNGLLIKSN